MCSHPVCPLISMHILPANVLPRAEQQGSAKEGEQKRGGSSEINRQEQSTPTDLQQPRAASSSQVILPTVHDSHSSHNSNASHPHSAMSHTSHHQPLTSNSSQQHSLTSHASASHANASHPHSAITSQQHSITSHQVTNSYQQHTSPSPNTSFSLLSPRLRDAHASATRTSMRVPTHPGGHAQVTATTGHASYILSNTGHVSGTGHATPLTFTPETDVTVDPHSEEGFLLQRPSTRESSQGNARECRGVLVFAWFSSVFIFVCTQACFPPSRPAVPANLPLPLIDCTQSQTQTHNKCSQACPPSSPTAAVALPVPDSKTSLIHLRDASSPVCPSPTLTHRSWVSVCAPKGEERNGNQH